MTKQKILLVDDEAIVRDSVSEWLKGDNYDVDCACDGNEAINKVKNSRFDTAVVDLKMPGMDGIEVTKHIKQLAPQTFIIIITAYGTVENAVEAMKLGVNDYLTKPFTMDKLEQALEGVNRHNSPTTTQVIPSPRPVEAVPVLEAEVDKESREKPAKQCIWSKAGIVSYRLCSNNFRCDSCEFAQGLMDTGGQAGDRSMVDAVKKMLEKPGPERACRYMLSGQVTYRLCSNVYRCGQCAFNEYMEEKLDAETAKMTAKLKAMQERKTSRLGKAAAG